MNSVHSIGRQASLISPSYAGKGIEYKFKDTLIKKEHEDVTQRFHSYSQGIAVPSVILNKLKAAPESMFKDVTYDEEYQHLHEHGPYKLFRAYVDNGEGDGGKAFYLIRLKTSSKDVVIDKNKLDEIFHKAMMIVNKMVPIYAKMNGTATLAGIDYMLPFNEASGEVDFKSFVKLLAEGTNSIISFMKLDDDLKEELQKLLKECEDYLLKALDSNEETEAKPDVADNCGINIEYRNKSE